MTAVLVNVNFCFLNVSKSDKKASNQENVTFFLKSRIKKGLSNTYCFCLVLKLSNSFAVKVLLVS